MALYQYKGLIMDFIDNLNLMSLFDYLHKNRMGLVDWEYAPRIFLAVMLLMHMSAEVYVAENNELMRGPQLIINGAVIYYRSTSIGRICVKILLKTYAMVTVYIYTNELLLHELSVIKWILPSPIDQIISYISSRVASVVLVTLISNYLLSISWIARSLYKAESAAASVWFKISTYLVDIYEVKYKKLGKTTSYKTTEEAYAQLWWNITRGDKTTSAGEAEQHAVRIWQRYGR